MLTKAARDEIRALVKRGDMELSTVELRMRNGRMFERLPALLDDLDAQDAEVARLTAENDQLIVIARADEWQARYWAEHDAVADREATIMAERAKLAAMRRALEDLIRLTEHVSKASNRSVNLDMHRAALQSRAGKALLAAHAAELAGLAAENQRWMGLCAEKEAEIDRVTEHRNQIRVEHAAELADKEQLRTRYADLWVKSTNECAALRQRSKALELELEGALKDKYEMVAQSAICDGSTERSRIESTKAAIAALWETNPEIAYESPAQVIAWLKGRTDAAEAKLRAVDDVLIVNHLGPRDDGDYRKALAGLISNNVAAEREQLNEAVAELANLRASQAADLNRIEESYNRLIRELEEGKRKAEAERDAAKRDTARLDWLLEKRYRHNGQIRIEVGEPSIWEEFPTPREAIDVAMQSDAPEDQ